jgi:predicted small secreted protein
MKRTLLLATALALGSATLMGCSNTAKGVDTDTEQNGAKVADAAKTAADATKTAADNAAAATKEAATTAAKGVKEAGKDVGAALDVTPKVKTAIIADTQLNDSRNLINVGSKDKVVHLEGHVVSASDKTRATAVATKTLKDMDSSFTVSNELTVKP